MKINNERVLFCTENYLLHACILPCDANDEKDSIFRVNMIFNETGEVRQSDERLKYSDNNNLNNLYAIRRIINEAIKYEKELSNSLKR